MINNDIFFKLLKKTLKLSTYKVLTRFFIYIYNSKLKSGTFILKKITTGWANSNAFHKKVIIMYKMKLNLFAYSKKNQNQPYLNARHALRRQTSRNTW